MAKIFWFLIVPMLTVLWLYHAYAGEPADHGGVPSIGTTAEFEAAVAAAETWIVSPALRPSRYRLAAVCWTSLRSHRCAG